MSTKTATNIDIKTQRGTKRTCQNPECGSRFYDLNRDPITCPVCSTVYQVVVAPVAVDRKPQRPEVKKPAYPVKAPKSEIAPELEGEELVAVEGEEEDANAEADEALIEEVEEDTPDVTSIIDAPIADTDEKT
jgi:uncharacterized protein (TIGR02300 family)